MADLPASGTRIVPIVAGRQPTPKPTQNASRSPRQRAAKAEKNSESLRLRCLDELNLYAAPIKGDGNCLFYCLSDQLYGMTDKHREIRERIVQHMRENKDYFIGFFADVGGERRAPRRAVAEQAKLSSRRKIDRVATKQGQEEKFEEMMCQMSKEGCWGGSVEIQAFCQAYGLNVHVYSDSGIQAFTSGPSRDEAEKSIMHVAYHSFQHYSSIRNVDGPHTGLPNIPKLPGAVVNGSMFTNGEVKPMNDVEEMSTLSMSEPWQISSIAEALPMWGRETIKDVLTQCSGDIERAFDKLLSSDPAELDVDSSLNSEASCSNDRINLPLLSSRAGLGSSSRSSSRHSTASKRRSPDDSDSDDVHGPVRRRGRDRKRRILQDVTVGISLQDEEKNDIVSIKLRVNPETVVEHAAGPSNTAVPWHGIPDERNDSPSDQSQGSDQGGVTLLTEDDSDRKNQHSDSDSDSMGDASDDSDYHDE